MLKTIWRHPATHAVLGTVLFLLVYGLTMGAAASAKPWRGTPGQLAITLAGVAIGIALYKWFERRVERRDDAEFPRAGAMRGVVAGLAVGFALFSTMAAVVALFGGFAIDGVRGLGAFWEMASMAAVSSVFEELLFRGILFRQIERWGGSWIALAITSAFFGAAHIANPGATWFAALAIALEAGLLLGAAYMLTRSLWLAIGIHAAWNFSEGWIYSTPVSGGKAPAGLLVTRLHGAEWLTGGAFGLEASAVAMVVATLAGCTMLALAGRGDGFVLPRWRRA